MALKLYEYNKCSTCKKAIKFLEAKKVKFDKVDITLDPPSKTQLKKMLKHLKSNGGKINNLFNTSGVLYREMDMKNKLPELSEDQALELLSKHGKLIKRPFILTTDSGVVGFKEDQWKTLFKK